MDFLLTPSGDITFEIYEKETDPLEISFIVSKTKALSLSFYIDSDSEIETNSTTLSLSFYVDNPTYNKTITTTTEVNEYEQKINMRLRTVMGDLLSHKELGSLIETMKHEFIDTCTMTSKLQKEITRALSDIIPNCKVTVVLKDNTYYGYKDCMVAYIQDQEKDKVFVYNI